MNSQALSPKQNRPAFFEDYRPAKKLFGPILKSPLRFCHEELTNAVDRKILRLLIESQIHVKKFFTSDRFQLPRSEEDECTNPISKLYEEVFVPIRECAEIYRANPTEITSVTKHEKFYRRDELVSSLRARMDYFSARLEWIMNQPIHYYRNDIHPSFLHHFPDRAFIPLAELKHVFALDNAQSLDLFGAALAFVKPNSFAWILSNGQLYDKGNLQRFCRLEIERCFFLISAISPNRFDFYISKINIPKELPPNILRSAKKYLQSSSILHKNGESFYKRIYEHLNKKRADLSCFYIKDDRDGYTEIKAKHVIRAITRGNPRYSEFFQQKILVDFTHAELKSPLKTCVVSRAVKNQVEVDEDLIETHSKARFDYWNAVYRHSNCIKTYEAELTALDAKLKATGKFSVPFHILTDILFFSCDSHVGQYIATQNVNNEIEYINIDFSRVLTNFTCFTTHNLHFCPFRSVFLFHPFSFEPMPSSLVQLIKSWNIEEIEKELIPLTGISLEFSIEVSHYWQKYWETYIKTENALNKIKQICSEQISPETFDLFIAQLQQTPKIDSWKIDRIINDFIPDYLYSPDFDLSVQKFCMENWNHLDSLQKAKDQIGQICFTKIHPATFSIFINRLIETKKYVALCQENQKAPTLYGLFEVLYPEIAVILNIFKRLTPDPAEMIFIELSGEEQFRRSIESIVDWSKQSKMATQQELEDLEQAVAKLKTQAAAYKDYIQFFSIL